MSPDSTAQGLRVRISDSTQREITFNQAGLYPLAVTPFQSGRRNTIFLYPVLERIPGEDLTPGSFTFKAVFRLIYN
jgi:type 1 fimbria pilin